MVLATGTPAVAGGYAQLDFDPASGPVAFAVRIALALDVTAALPVAITTGAAADDNTAEQIAAAITDSGFRWVTVMDRTEAEILPPDGAAGSETLDGVDIPSGLLTSHAGLTLQDLAAAVGAGLRLLSTEISIEPASDVPGGTDGDWSPASNAPPASATDPFTSGASSTAAGVAATVAAAAAVAALGDDDDLTIAAPAGRLTAPKSPGKAAAGPPDDLFAVDDVDDITIPAPARSASGDSPAESDPEPGAAGADVAMVLEDDATVNPDDDAHDYEDDEDDATVLEDDATVNPDDMPAAAVAAAEGIVEDNIDETVMMDRATLRKAAAADNAAAGGAVAASAGGPAGTSSPAVAVQNEPEGGRKRLLLIAAAAVALVALIALAATQCGGSDNESTSTVETAAEGSVDSRSGNTEAETVATSASPESEVDAPPLAADPTAPPEPTAAPTATAEPAPTPEPEPTVDPLAGLPALSTLPERGAIFRPPTLFLEGPVQTQEQADELYERAIAVVGPDNVVNNYVVRPDAPAALDGNVRVEQAVLFQTGSADIADQFIPTLELGVAVMALNPQVQMVVEGHTDSVGSEAVNVALSQRRAEAVVAYLESRGVDIERLEAVGLGETIPVADNDTADGRQINRRIEVNLLDLLAAE